LYGNELRVKVIALLRNWSDACYHCHGPDAKARESDLRLDDRTSALEADVFSSGEMLKRLTSEDRDVRMPPPDSKRRLRARDRAKLARWLENGAPWPEDDRHWAFIPPARPDRPQVTNRAWPRNGIDDFVLARLEKEGLSFQSGGPSQMDLFDYKPELVKRFGEEAPTSVYPAERKTTMASGQKSFPVAPSAFKFARQGKSGIWLSENLPRLAEVIDEVCVIKSMHTEAINHDPATTLFQTGSMIASRPSMGAWMSYGLGAENANLPAFVALTSNGSAKTGQPLYDRLWSAGFLPGQFQGVKFRGQGDPILDFYNPAGVTRNQRRRMLDSLRKLNRESADQFNDPTIAARIAQYELAYRMQMSVPELIHVKSEPQSILDMYGPQATQVGKYAYNCLLARRLAERGVRFILLYHRGWDAHNNAQKQVPAQCRDTDQPTAALLRDLKQRGMLDDTLVVWGGELGRTIYCQGKLTDKVYGRDHHPNCFTYWMAGGGVRGGMSYGETDE
jgi:hypothetical protein